MNVAHVCSKFHFTGDIYDDFKRIQSPTVEPVKPLFQMVKHTYWWDLPTATFSDVHYMKQKCACGVQKSASEKLHSH